MRLETYLGIMSGTSLDGIDLALVNFEQAQPQLVACCSHDFPSGLRQRLLKLCSGEPTTLQALGEAEQQLSMLYAEAVNQFLQSQASLRDGIRAIGCHGQTVHHAPKGDYPFTMQLLDGNRLAVSTSLDVVADFRGLDMALGGQGAPLVPAFHQQVFSASDSQTTAVLNIGGIANLSVLQANGKVLGFDTGPGNLLSDAWIAKHQGQRFDKGGQWAGSGQVIASLLERLLSEPFLAEAPPKSTGRELFNLDWLEPQLVEDYLAEDVQATLLEFTAQSIAQALLKAAEVKHGELFVCGGGVHNRVLMQALTRLLPDWQVQSTEAAGVDPDYMEAIAFAWLARQRVLGLSSNLPAVTGAAAAVSLGVLYPAP